MKFIPFESDNDEELINDLNTLEIKEKEKTDFIPKEKDNKINISEDEEEENNEYSYLKNPFHKLDEYKIIRNEILKFLPQIEIVFSVNVKINNKMIDELKNELKDILENNDFSIIEINKGSLKIIVTLQYIYKELIKKMKNNPANKNVKNWQKITDKEVKNVLEKLIQTKFLFIGGKSPDFVYESVINIRDKCNQRKMTQLFRALNQGQNKFLKKNYNIFENAKNISLDELEKFINIISDEAKKQECNVINF